LTPEVAAGVAYGASNVKGLLRFDAPTIEANRSAWVEKWNKAIAKK
jgi:putative spermidine/putrescine transport system substrate-binding protein